MENVIFFNDFLVDLLLWLVSNFSRFILVCILDFEHLDKKWKLVEWIRGNEHQLRKEREEGNHETKQYHNLKQGEFRYGIRRITDLKRSEH